MHQKQIAVFILAAIAALLLAAGLPAAAQSVNISQVRVVNALVGFGPVDVFLDGQRIAYGLEARASTSYVFTASGNHIIAVRPVNADPLSPPIADALINLTPNSSQTAIAYHKQFATTGAGGQSIIPPTEQSGAFFVIDDDRSPIRLGLTRLTGVHLALGTPQKLSVGYPSGEALLFSLGLEQRYGTVDIPAGSYRLAVIDAESPTLTTLGRFGDESFYANTLYTLIIVPDIAPVGSNAYQVGPVSPQPALIVVSAPIDPPQTDGLRLRIVHAAHSTTVLDIYLDEQLVASRVNYGIATEYLGLAAFSHTITLRRFGAPAEDPPLGRAVFTITPENVEQINWTLLLLNSTPQNSAEVLASQAQAGTNAPSIVSNPEGDIMVTLLPDNIGATQSDQARVRVINAADGLPAVSLFTKNFPAPPLAAGAPVVQPTAGPPPPPEQVTDSVLFGVEANDADVPAGLYEELTFVPLGSTGALATLQNQQLVPGVVYTFILIGSPTGSPPIEVLTLQDFGRGVSARRTYEGEITTASARVREAPSLQGRQIASLPQGTKVTVLGRDANAEWLRIRFTNPANGQSQDGWIAGTLGIIRVTRLGAVVEIETLPIFSGR